MATLTVTLKNEKFHCLWNHDLTVTV